MNPKNLKYVGIGGVAIYALYLMGGMISPRLDVQSEYLREMKEVMIHSNTVQEEMLEAMEVSNDLHRIKYGLRLEPDDIKPATREDI